ncbi:MAG: permease-like cell division protein FtsX [Myxococcota bacterium]
MKGYRFLGTWRAGRSNWRLQALSVFSLAVAFVCLASALLVVTNLSHIRDRWSRAGRATVYLQDDASEADVRALVMALEKTEGVANARYVSRSLARDEVLADRDAAELADLPPEAFPASVELRFDETVDAVALNVLALKLRSLGTVEMVETYEKWTDKLSGLLSGGVTAALFLALVVFGAVVSVVGSTMRLLLEKRRIEVEVLRLVGATTRFVCRPFVVEGAMQGASGAAVATGLLAVLYLIVRGRFDAQLGVLLGVEPAFLPWSMVAGMVALGASLGAATAWLSLRKAVKQ